MLLKMWFLDPQHQHNLGTCCYLVAQLCPTFCDPMDCSTPGFPVLHHLPELAQIHVHWVIDAIQPSHPLPPPSPPAFSLSQHPGIFQWAGSSHLYINLIFPLLCPFNEKTILFTLLVINSLKMHSEIELFSLFFNSLLFFW